MKKRRLLFGLVACGLLASTSSTLLERTKVNPKQGIKYDSVASATNGGSFNKITSTSELTDGDYLIVYEAGNVAFDGSLPTLDGASNTIDVTITNGSIILDNTNKNSYFTINNTTNTIKSASGYYIGKTANSNGLDSSTTKSYTNEITFDNNGNSVITSSGAPTLKYNSASDQLRFRYYKTGQKDIQLYKFVAETSEEKYTLSYQLFGGINHVSNPTYVTQGSSLTLQDPTYDGYTFDGWYTTYNENTKTYSNKVEGEYTPTENTTFYAKWNKVAVTDVSNLENGNKYRVFAKVTGKYHYSKTYYTFLQNGDTPFVVSDEDFYNEKDVGTVLDLYGTYNNKFFSNLVYADTSQENVTVNQITSFNNITENDLYKSVNISGAVVESVSNKSVYFNGTEVYLYNTTATSVSVGDALNINGVVYEYSNKLQIVPNTVEIIEANNVTFHFNNGSNDLIIPVVSGQTVSAPNTPIKADDETTRYTFNGWYTDENCSQEYNFDTPVTEAIDLYAGYDEKTIYTVTYDSKGGTSVDSQTIEYDTTQHFTRPSNPTKESTDYSDFTFGGWYLDSDFNGEAYDFENAVVTGNITLYAKWISIPNTSAALSTFTAQSTKASLNYKFINKCKDTLDRAQTGISGTTYGEWSGKEGTTGAVYAGSSAGGNDSIQLRSDKSSSGIVTTTSGGKAKKVSVVWESHTSNGRTLNIYGKNSAYSAATDLYSNDSSTQGTLLGTIVNGTSTELTISGDYEYIGLRSNSGAMYLSSVAIQWGENEHEITKAGIRFGGLVNKDVFDALDVDGYGVMVGTTANVEAVDGNDTDVTSIEEAFVYHCSETSSYDDAIAALANDKITNVYVSGKNPAIAEDNQKAALPEGNYYVWNAYVNIPSSKYYNTSISAVAYIKVDGEYIFMQEKKTTLVQLANDYLATDTYDENSFEGSLYYLANNDWGN